MDLFSENKQKIEDYFFKLIHKRIEPGKTDMGK